MKKFAFTLSEVLITIGIIGVVAALTIPNLIHKTRAKELQTQLKHANSIIQNGIGRMLSDEVNVTEVFTNTDYTTLKKYFKAGACTNVPNTLGETHYTNYWGGSVFGAWCQTWIYPPICLNDGTLLMFGKLNTAKQEATNYRTIMVDINGFSKKPNKFGYDVFFWLFNSETNRVLPLSSILTPDLPSPRYYVCPTKYEVGNEWGIGCTLNALNEPDYFLNLKF